MSLLARHLVIDMYGCNARSLANSDFIKEALLATITESNLTLLDFTCHSILPHGMAANILLAESHLTIHTYPELGYAAIDIFSFGDKLRPEKAIGILKTFFKPEKMKTTTLKRGDFGSQKEMKPKITISVAPLRRVKNTGAKVLKLLSRSK